MAPESVKKMEYTRFSDIWAIGCLVIEMITGEPPWSDYKNPMAVLFQLYNNNSPPPIPENISSSLKDFVNSCLQINPSSRLNIYQLLRHSFITGSKLNRLNKLDLSHFNSGGEKITSLTVSLENDKSISSGSETCQKPSSGDSDKSKGKNNFNYEPEKIGNVKVQIDQNELSNYISKNNSTTSNYLKNRLLEDSVLDVDKRKSILSVKQNDKIKKNISSFIE